MKHYGDVTRIKGNEVPIVDIITGGSPCQDLSVAGKRAGLAGERSGLFMEQIRIIKEMRDECKRRLGELGRSDEYIRPRYMVWENVPGAFSSNKGEDFQAVLTEIVRIVKPNAPDVPLFGGGKRWAKSGCLMGIGEDGQPFSIAYRLHDAQFWGVPQRRKRIALVADFGGSSAPEILFERSCVSGDIEESGKKGKDTSETAGADPIKAISFQERAGCDGGVKESSYSMSEQEHYQPSTINQYSECKTVVLEGNGSRPSHQGNGYAESDVSYTLNAVEQHGVCVPVNVGGQQSEVYSVWHDIRSARLTDDGKTDPLCGTDYKEPPFVCYGMDAHNVGINEDKSHTLIVGQDDNHNVPCVTYSQDAYDKYTQTDTSATIKQSGGNFGGGSELLIIQ